MGPTSFPDTQCCFFIKLPLKAQQNPSEMYINIEHYITVFVNLSLLKELEKDLHDEAMLSYLILPLVLIIYLLK